jgi:hypothetical protein
MPQKKCDWNGCSEIGFFDGLDKKLLTDQAKKHISAFLKLVFLCPCHFNLGVGGSYKKNQAPEPETGINRDLKTDCETMINEILARSNELIARSEAWHKKSGS